MKRVGEGQKLELYNMAGEPCQVFCVSHKPCNPLVFPYTWLLTVHAPLLFWKWRGWLRPEILQALLEDRSNGVRAEEDVNHESIVWPPLKPET
jgi:hypothetical protein